MKKQFLLALAAGLALCSPAFAQTFFTPTSADLLAPGSTNTSAFGCRNTGNDIIQLSGTTDKLHAMVWDNVTAGLDVTFGWSINGGTGNSTTVLSPISGASLSDPDITMAYFSGTLYADLVYLVNDPNTGTTQTYLDVYRWNGTTFSRHIPFGGPRALGKASFTNDPAYGSANHLHSNCNIDANASGKVGIVWQETSTETVQATIFSPTYSAPDYPSGYSFPLTTTFADSYVLDCNIDGSGFYCGTPYRGVLATRLPGTPPSVPNPNILFNQSLSPDVAVTPDNIISFCYLASSANPTGTPVTAGRSLVVKQYTRDCNIFYAPTSIGTYSWDASGTTGVPRIAANPNPNSTYFHDVEVVMSWAGSGCIANLGTRTYNEIRNWGRSAGTWRSSYNVVSIPTVSSQNGYADRLPAVAFTGADGTSYNNTYSVIWSAFNYPTAGNSQDVWSRTLLGGVLQSSNYSRVNNNATGIQNYQSIAGRYSNVKNQTAMVWYDDNQAQIYYRNPTVQAGSGGLNRPAAGGSTTGSSTPPRVLEAFPNPFNTSVDFRVNLQANEVVQSIQVTDLSGRVLDTVPVPAARSEASKEAAPAAFSWSPKRSLNTGSYLVRVITNQRTETLPLGKN